MSTVVNIKTINTLRPKPELNRALVAVLDNESVGSDKIHLVENLNKLEELFPRTPTSTKNELFELAQIEYLINAGLAVVVLETGESTLKKDIEDLLEENDNNFNVSVVTIPKGATDNVLGEVSGVFKDLKVELHLDTTLSRVDGLHKEVGNNRNVSFFSGKGVLGFRSNYQFIDSNTEAEPVLILASVAAQARKLLNRHNHTPYLPIAGEKYGVFEEFIDLEERLSRKDKTDLQAAYVNPLYLKTGVGVHFVAQNTRNSILPIHKLNPLNRGHANTLTNYLAERLKEIGDSYLFETNNETTWNHLTLDIEKLLGSFVGRDGIETYAVVTGRRVMTEEDIAGGQLKAQIHFLPVRVIEDVELNLVVHDGERTIVEVVNDIEDEVPAPGGGGE